MLSARTCAMVLHHTHRALPHPYLIALLPIVAIVHCGRWRCPCVAERCVRRAMDRRMLVLLPVLVAWLVSCQV